MSSQGETSSSMYCRKCGCLLAILQARHPGALWTSARDAYLLLGLIVLAVELALLMQVFWLMLPRGPSKATDQGQSAGDSQGAPVRRRGRRTK
jgi:hypothetical protein